MPFVNVEKQRRFWAQENAEPQRRAEFLVKQTVAKAEE